MSKTSNGGNCRECRGTGRVMLLTSSVPCAACGGAGRAAAAASGPPRPGVHTPGLAVPAAADVTCDVQRDDSGRAVCVTRLAYDERGRLVRQSTEYFPDERGDGDGGEPEAPASCAVATYTYYGEDEENG
jgi:hypothetical protein